MNKAGQIDPLRERLLASELSRARWLAEARGGAGLLERAAECVAEVALEQARLSAGSLPTGSVDFATHTEGVARRVLELELEAEACLAVARPLLSLPPGEAELGKLLELAERPGRWSRQTQALVLLRDTAPRLEPSQRRRVQQALETLIKPSAPRWVQPAALDALVAFDQARAFHVAKHRLAHDAGGEDFIVRSRIVELCARHHKRGWQALLPLAYEDRSELVRTCAARATHAKPELERLAVFDSSHRVRAIALIKLRRRFASAATANLKRALEQDAHHFVVETAAHELCSLCRLRPELASLEHAAALGRASQRRELPPAVRATCRELSLEVGVLASGGARLLGSLRLATEATPLGEARVTTDSDIAAASDDQLSRALAVVSRDDFGIGLTRTPKGMRLHRGERPRFAVWRLLYELLHPASSKRQAFRHTVARRADGDLRAHPQRMAEVTATAVPGERVLIPEQGDWGRHLPLVEDLLSLDVLESAQLRLANGLGVTVVQSPTTLRQRFKARLALWWGYAELARLRERALASSERHVQAAYADEVERRTGITMRLQPGAHAGDAPQLQKLVSDPPSANHALAALVPLLGLEAGGGPGEARTSLWQDLASYAASTGGNRLSHLAVFAAVLLGAMTLRGVGVRRAVERDRRAIPLVIGGWGTRGKSGTERLKGALFQGMGYEVLVKTTGCEAMFIHAVPGMTAREVFIYRPYDKATVWEQRDVLSLARRFGVKVFLWECMALQPDLVDLLQAQWMRDDYSTITNAYPDHEDLQGPTGFDVATTISQFVPRAGRLLTSEEQMLPLLREQARARNSRLTEVTARDAELIPEDLLSRFGHAEHPRNVALVLRLARSLGISASVALTEMADNVVPDLGVLKTYGPLTWQGRELSFTNGMGANDRAGTLGNWERAGFARLAVDQPGRWVVTVVNNRADRVARSEVFAKLLTEELNAHRHVLIGTNVVGLQGMIERALAAHVETLSLTQDLPSDAEARLPVVRERVRRALERLMLSNLSPAAALAEAAVVAQPDLLTKLDSMRPPDGSDESYATALEVVARELRGCVDEASLPFLARAVARRRLAAGLLLAIETRFNGEPARVDAQFRSTYSDLFRDSIVALHDHKLGGDALISQIANSLPPGARASLMGMQNIKGTGLDFVYRWISADAVLALLTQLERAPDAERAELFKRLLAHGDYGLVDASTALTRIDALDPTESDTERSLREALTDRLRDIIAQRTSAGTSGKRGSLGSHLLKLGRASFDFIDSVLRRRQADRIVAALVGGRISHAQAARDMRALVARGKARDA